MCGRVNITDNEGIRLLLSMLGIGLADAWQDSHRHNVAPTSTLQCLVRENTEASSGNPPLVLRDCHWGLIPVWARPGQFKSPLINARSETVHDKPSFRNLVKHQRLLLPVTGFYEWQRQEKLKTPFYIYPADEQPMLIAGVFQVSRKSRDTETDNTPPETTIDFALLTTAANDAMAQIHDRMPVIIPRASAEDWLLDDDPQNIDALMQPMSNDYLAFRRVSTHVNNAHNDGPECTAPADLFD